MCLMSILHGACRVAGSVRILVRHEMPETNPPVGVVFNYYLKDVIDSTRASVAIMDKNHQLIKTFSTSSKDDKLDISKGMNQFVWNMRYPDAEKIEGMILWTGGPNTITASPGNYLPGSK